METGVYGAGHNGIMGVGAQGRGGIFQSENSAQLQLVPLKVSGSTTQAEFLPTAITDAGRLMPKTGHRGDLMAVIDEKRTLLALVLRSRTTGFDRALCSMGTGAVRSGCHWQSVIFIFRNSVAISRRFAIASAV